MLRRSFLNLGIAGLAGNLLKPKAKPKPAKTRTISIDVGNSFAVDSDDIEARVDPRREEIKTYTVEEFLEHTADIIRGMRVPEGVPVNIVLAGVKLTPHPSDTFDV